MRLRRYAEHEASVAAAALAWAQTSLAVLALLLVFCRMSYHNLLVMRGEALWNDPLNPRLVHLASREQPAAGAKGDPGGKNVDASQQRA